MSNMIFPGMDPYLENPHFWPGFHNHYLVYAAEQLQPKIEPRYIAAIEGRVYLEGADRDIIHDAWLAGDPRGVYATWHPAAPQGSEVISQPVVVTDDEIEVSEAYITILDMESNQRIVTVIEMLSPSNKLPGSGRREYQKKQREVRSSDSHLMEIDLLRAGMHTVAAPVDKVAAHRHDYLVSVNRARQARKSFELYFIQLRQQLPTVGVPLANGDPDVPLDLQSVLQRVYDAGRFRSRIRYEKAPIPPLPPPEQSWASELVAAAGAKPPAT